MAARKRLRLRSPLHELRSLIGPLTSLRDLVDWSAVDQQIPVRGDAVYTRGVVVWMLVSQRMSPERSLESAAKRLIDTQPDFLPHNKRLTEKTLSNSTGGYSRPRSRLQREAAEWFAEQVRDSLIESTAPSFDERRVYMVDGTTITITITITPESSPAARTGQPTRARGAPVRRNANRILICHRMQPWKSACTRSVFMTR